MPKKRSWTFEELENAAASSFSFGEVLRRLNLYPGGANYQQIHKYFNETGINISHFRGRTWNKGMRGIGKPRIALEAILVKNSDYQSFKLKRRLFKAGLKHQYCEQCGWAQKTVDGFLPLELDHINGDHYDNRIENLRVLCPNCHSLTPHHRGRGGRKK